MRTKLAITRSACSSESEADRRALSHAASARARSRRALSSSARTPFPLHHDRAARVSQQRGSRLEARQRRPTVRIGAPARPAAAGTGSERRWERRSVRQLGAPGVREAGRGEEGTA